MDYTILSNEIRLPQYEDTMTAIALPRQPHTDFLSRLRSIGLGLGGRGSLGWGLGRSRAGAAAATPWYLAGGAPMPVAAYQPIGAASLAASYVNLANPGTYDAAPGVAPTWASATGWTFDGVNKYLVTTIQTSPQWSAAVRFSNAVAADSYMFGAMGNWDRRFAMQANYAGYHNYQNGGYINVSPGLVSGVMIFAAKRGYLNGVEETSAMSGDGQPNYPVHIGQLNYYGSSYGKFSGSIQALAIYNTTLTAPQVAAVSAAMAAL